MTEYLTRPVTSLDLEVVCHHREEMFRGAGAPEADVVAMAPAFRQWLESRLREGSYTGWIVEHSGTPVAGTGFIVLDWPPHPRHPADNRRGYVLNVFVEPPHRSHGLATMLMKLAAEEARSRGIVFLALHATAAGRPVYEKLGWQPMPEMSLAIG